MKKLYLIILLVFILLASGCSLIETVFEPVSEVELVNLQNGEKVVFQGDSDDKKIILEAIKAKNETKDKISDFTSYEVNITRNSKIENYKLSFDIENKAVYVSHSENTYMVDANVAKELFLNENFYYVYIDSTLYEAFLDYNEDKINPNIKYNWTYKDIEGHFINKEGAVKGDVDKEGINIVEEDALDIAYEKVPDSQVVRIYKDGNLISTGTKLQDILNNIIDNGEYAVESQVQWLLREGSQFYGNQTLMFTINVNRPPRVSVVTKENSPGNIMLVYVENLKGDESLKLKTDAVKVETDMYEHKGKKVFVCPIDLYAEPKDYELSVVVNEGTTSEYVITSNFSVKSKAFKTQYLTVSEEMNETNNDNTAIYEFAQLVKPARAESVIEKLWEGTFIMPVEGELTTDFAEIRFVNNEQSSSRHSGLDIAAPKGTEIKAPNNGVVTFAMEGLLSPGSTVVIDHGMGLFTSYYHLDSIAVEKGQKVKKGEVIGTVGTTGFSTGPHLHYAVSIYNTYVNPYQPLSGIID